MNNVISNEEVSPHMKELTKAKLPYIQPDRNRLLIATIIT
jgi:hypothetical protein